MAGTLNIHTVLSALRLAGTTLPAFKALFEEVKNTFGYNDQLALQKAYDEAIAASDKDHEEVQALLSQAAGPTDLPPPPKAPPRQKPADKPE